MNPDNIHTGRSSNVRGCPKCSELQVRRVKSTTEYHEMCICEYIWFIYATTIYTFWLLLGM